MKTYYFFYKASIKDNDTTYQGVFTWDADSSYPRFDEAFSRLLTLMAKEYKVELSKIDMEQFNLLPY